jgi:hypothetical protein
MRPILLAFILVVVCMIFLSSFSLCNTSSYLTRSIQLCYPFFSSTFQNLLGISYLLFLVSKFLHHKKLFPKCSTLLVSSLSFKSYLLLKIVFFLLNAAFFMEILDLVSHVHVASFVITLHKYFKYIHILQLF